jgi:hypothetical protein
MFYQIEIDRTYINASVKAAYKSLYLSPCMIEFQAGIKIIYVIPELR